MMTMILYQILTEFSTDLEKNRELNDNTDEAKVTNSNGVFYLY